MHISPKVLVLGLLIIAIPAVVGTALTVQNLHQNASFTAPLLSVSPTKLDQTNCPSDGTNYQCSIKLTNNAQFTLPWKLISQGLDNMTVNPQSGSLSASQSTTVNITIPVASCTIGKSARFQFVPGGIEAAALFTCTPLSGTPTPQQGVSKLSCDDCQANGDNTLCFNITTRTAECRNGNGNNMPVSTFGALCIRCPQVTPIASVSPVPTGICTPRPPCLDAVPRCTIPEPFGGWCPPTGTPTPTIPTGCKPIACTIACPVNNPHCCPVRYVCPSGTPTSTPTPTLPQGQ